MPMIIRQTRMTQLGDFGANCIPSHQPSQCTRCTADPGQRGHKMAVLSGLGLANREGCGGRGKSGRDHLGEEWRGQPIEREAGMVHGTYGAVHLRRRRAGPNGRRGDAGCTRPIILFLWSFIFFVEKRSFFLLPSFVVLWQMPASTAT